MENITAGEAPAFTLDLDAIKPDSSGKYSPLVRPGASTRPASRPPSCTPWAAWERKCDMKKWFEKLFCSAGSNSNEDVQSQNVDYVLMKVHDGGYRTMPVVWFYGTPYVFRGYELENKSRDYLGELLPGGEFIGEKWLIAWRPATDRMKLWFDKGASSEQ